QLQAVAIELQKLPSVQETVTVSATRTDRGLEDQPMRVEVLDAEEIDEKLMMTPGDVVLAIAWITVRDRTTEIGTRRALGATASDVFVQFVFEASVLALVGTASGFWLGFVA